MEHHHYHQHDEQGSGIKHKLLLGGVLGASGLIAAPYVGDLITGGDAVPEIMSGLHGTQLGSGLAGGFNSLLNSVPLVGETLSAGGMATAISSGVIGIGGVLLGNYIDKKPRREKSLPWGKIIKYAAITTSLLIALPSILTGISIGVSYLAGLGGVELASSAMDLMANTIGATGASGASSAGVGLSTAFTHLLTCGGAALSMCGAIYLDRDSAKKPSIELANNPIIKKGESAELAFRVKNSDGKALADTDLKETHTKKLHLMIVDSSLRDYHHVHPEYDQASGLFKTSFTPTTSNKYSAWSDFALCDDTHAILKTDLPVNNALDIKASIQHESSASTDEFNINIIANPPLAAGKDSTLLVDITDKSGKPAQLEEIMGAKAHLAGFSKDGQDFIHCHPTGENEGVLQFHVAPKNEGFTKFFLQIKTDGAEKFIPFGQYIQPPEKFAERTEHAHKNHSMAVA